MANAVSQDVPSCAGCAASGFSRRQFVSAATLVAVAAILESCTAATGPGGGSTSGGPITVKLSNFPALSAVGGIARVDSGGSPTALVRTGTSTFIGLSMICTHQGSTIAITNGSFTCPNHGARFNSSGAWIGGQSASNLQSFSATYDAVAGTIVINRPS
jgi:cytochrome b6-f complex iron-sulfur subunit